MREVYIFNCTSWNLFPLSFLDECIVYNKWFNIFSWCVVSFTVYLERNLIHKLGTVFILIFALGNIVSGFIPADVHLFWHSILSQIGMITVLFGLWIYAKSLTKGKRWTYLNLFVLIFILILIVLLFFFPLPAGLLQRLFYAVIFLWGTVLTILLSSSE